MESVERFLKRHSDALASVRDRRSLSAWHRAFAAEWSAQADALSAALNVEFDLGGPFAIRPDVGYIAVERREAERSNARTRLLLVSANPGWHEVTNPVEARLKHGDGASLDAESYESFRTEFFPRWYGEVMQPHRPRGAAWWNHARIFLHEVAGLAPPKGTCSFAPELDVIGWELWPFHSTGDGLTGAVFERADDSPSGLVDFAKASLRAACRMDVDGLVIASAAGFDLFLEHLADDFEQGPHQTIGKIECAAFRDRETGRPVVAVRRQLFSGFGVPSRVTRHAIAAFAAQAFANMASFSAPARAAVATERRSEPEYEPLHVALVRTEDVASSPSPVTMLLVPVSGVPDGNAPLNALDGEDDEDTVHEEEHGARPSDRRRAREWETRAHWRVCRWVPRSLARDSSTGRGDAHRVYARQERRAVGSARSPTRVRLRPASWHPDRESLRNRLRADPPRGRKASISVPHGRSRRRRANWAKTNVRNPPRVANGVFRRVCSRRGRAGAERRRLATAWPRLLDVESFANSKQDPIRVRNIPHE